MSGLKLLAIALIVAGALALTYRTFTYTKETHTAKVGALELSVKDRERVNVPVWAGVAALVVGAGLLLTSRRRS
jgi:LPXTG-motif cell wall-anchored protein